MADFSISQFTQKVQDFINEHKIDKNADGYINEANGELAALLSGTQAESVDELLMTDSVKFGNTTQNDSDNKKLKDFVVNVLNVMLNEINKGEFDNIEKYIENIYADLGGSVEPYIRDQISYIMSQVTDLKESKVETDAKYSNYIEATIKAMSNSENPSEVSDDLSKHIYAALDKLKDLPAASDDKIMALLDKMVQLLLANPCFAQLENSPDVDKLKDLFVWLSETIEEEKESSKNNLNGAITGLMTQLLSDDVSTEKIHDILQYISSMLDETHENDDIEKILEETLYQMSKIAAASGVDNPQADANSKIETTKVMTPDGMVIREKHPDGTVYETGLNGVRRQVQ